MRSTTAGLTLGTLAAVLLVGCININICSTVNTTTRFRAPGIVANRCADGEGPIRYSVEGGGFAGAAIPVAVGPAASAAATVATNAPTPTPVGSR